MKNFKVEFNLDGTGMWYDPTTPIHLDALMSWCLTPFHIPIEDRNISRDDEPTFIPIPVLQETINGHKVFCASALSPEGFFAEDNSFYKKSFRENRIEITKGSPTLTNGEYRAYKNNIPLILTHKMVAYCVSDCKKKLKSALRSLKYLGKKRAYGFGRIVKIEIEEVNYNYSLFKNGKTNRFIPSENGTRFVRPMPPYWNGYGKIKCLDIGVNYDR